MLNSKEIQQIFTTIDSGLIVQNVQPVSGGDINRAMQVETCNGRFFIKYNSAVRFPNMFEKEVQGLELLRKAGGVKTPRIFGLGEVHRWAYLVLEWLDSSVESDNFARDFGAVLAQMHRATSKQFGLGYPNYIGSLVQQNHWRDSWEEFFWQMRIQPQLKQAVDGKRLSGTLMKKVEKVCARLSHWLPIEPPALLHGDLWAGNYLLGANDPVLIDPAVYYGHREVDIAMMHLFGGFSAQIFEEYHAYFPLEPGWKERLDIHNIYPVLVHINLFGGSYTHQLEHMIDRFV